MTGDDVALADGTVVRIREIRPEDADALVAFHARLSPQSIILRYFGPHPRLSDSEVHRLTNVDGVDRYAVVALLDDRIVGVARYEREPGSPEAEVAFLVTDELQGKRLGTVFFERLVEAARRQGITRLVADTLAENTRMLGVFRDSGYRRHYDRFSEVVQVVLDIDEDGVGADGDPA
ncbi:MAG TPA: GNAT family N-acetyltransferase [Acidimicrobiales bacterium]|nr:GNAT family N-acetyltransferase [Acidimicrobiales bacterium]